MKTIELNDDDWARLKRKLMNGSVDDALKDYTPPVKLTHGTDCLLYTSAMRSSASSSLLRCFSSSVRSLPPGGAMPSSIAVSYTHLDVYKRQVDGLHVYAMNQPDIACAAAEAVAAAGLR